MRKIMRENTQIGIQINTKSSCSFVFCFVLFSVAIAFLNVVPSIANAAELYLETSQPEYAPNETFIADIRLNVTPPESINAIEAYLEFPKNILKVVDFSTGNSILTFIEEPKINQEKGLISFVGIIPGGYSGRLLGDPGKSNLLGRIVLRTIRETTQNGTRNYAKIEFLDNSQVLLSDGKGTPAKLTTKGVIIEVQPPQDVLLKIQVQKAFF